MLNREAELGIMNARARGGRFRLHHDQSPVDLLPPVHAGGVLLADEAALGEAYTVQFGRIAFEPENVAKLGAAFANPKPEAVFEPTDGVLTGRAQPALAQVGQAWVGPFLALERPVDRETVVALNADWTAQAIDREPFDQIVRGLGLAVEQQILAVGPHEEVEQALALGRQQPRPHGQVPSHIAGDQSLEEAAHVLAGETNESTVREGG